MRIFRRQEMLKPFVWCSLMGSRQLTRADAWQPPVLDHPILDRMKEIPAKEVLIEKAPQVSKSFEAFLSDLTAEFKVAHSLEGSLSGMIDVFDDWDTFAAGVIQQGEQLYCPRFTMSFSGKHALGLASPSDWSVTWKATLAHKKTELFSHPIPLKWLHIGLSKAEGCSIQLSRMTAKVVKKTALEAGADIPDAAFFRTNTLISAFHHDQYNRLQGEQPFREGWKGSWEIAWDGDGATKCLADPNDSTIQYRGSTSHLGLGIEKRAERHRFSVHVAGGWLRTSKKEKIAYNITDFYQSPNNDVFALTPLEIQLTPLKHLGGLVGGSYTFEFGRFNFQIKGSYVHNAIHLMTTKKPKRPENQSDATNLTSDRLYEHAFRHAADLSLGIYQKNVWGTRFHCGLEMGLNVLNGVESEAIYFQPSAPGLGNWVTHSSKADGWRSKDCYVALGLSSLLCSSLKCSGFVGIQLNFAPYLPDRFQMPGEYPPFQKDAWVDKQGWAKFSQLFKLKIGLQASQKWMTAKS